MGNMAHLSGKVLNESGDPVGGHAHVIEVFKVGAGGATEPVTDPFLHDAGTGTYQTTLDALGTYKIKVNGEWAAIPDEIVVPDHSPKTQDVQRATGLKIIEGVVYRKDGDPVSDPQTVQWRIWSECSNAYVYMGDGVETDADGSYKVWLGKYKYQMWINGCKAFEDLPGYPRRYTVTASATVDLKRECLPPDSLLRLWGEGDSAQQKK